MAYPHWDGKKGTRLAAIDAVLVALHKRQHSGLLGFVVEQDGVRFGFAAFGSDA